MNPTALHKTILFLHIPKVGGTTIEKVMARHYRKKQILVVDSPRGKNFQKLVSLSDAEKQNLRVIQGQFGIGIHQLLPQPSEYFCLLRHPIERAISYYYYIRRLATHSFHRTLVEENIGLDEYVERGISRQGIDNGQTRMLGGGLLMADEIPFGGVTRDLLEQAKHNLREHVAVIGTLEQFDDTLFLLHKTFGWRTPWYVRQNIGTNRVPSDAVAPRTLKLLHEHNRHDFELWAFAQELLREKLAAQSPAFQMARNTFKLMIRYPKLRAIYRQLRGMPLKEAAR